MGKSEKGVFPKIAILRGNIMINHGIGTLFFRQAHMGLVSENGDTTALYCIYSDQIMGKMRFEATCSFSRSIDEKIHPVKSCPQGCDAAPTQNPKPPRP